MVVRDNATSGPRRLKVRWAPAPDNHSHGWLKQRLTGSIRIQVHPDEPSEEIRSFDRTWTHEYWGSTGGSDRERRRPSHTACK